MFPWSCCALTGSDEGPGEKIEKAGVQRSGVTMTGPLTELLVSVSGLSRGRRAAAVPEEHC